MDCLAAPASCHILTRARHRVAMVTVREHALIWIHNGTKTLLSAAAPLSFAAGQAVVLLQDSVWDVINDPHPDCRYEATVLQFGDDALKACIDLAPGGAVASATRGCAPATMDDEMAQAVRRAADTLARCDTSAALRQHRTVEVLLLLAERGTRLEPRAALNWPDRLRRLVAQRPHADWSVSVLAQACHVSASTLQRRLAAAGSTVADVVRETRLETALALLQTTDLGVGDIAHRCGYESHSRFTATFRQRFGFAPSDLRDSAQDLSVLG